MLGAVLLKSCAEYHLLNQYLLPGAPELTGMQKSEFLFQEKQPECWLENSHFSKGFFPNSTQLSFKFEFNREFSFLNYWASVLEFPACIAVYPRGKPPFGKGALSECWMNAGRKLNVCTCTIFTALLNKSCKWSLCVCRLQSKVIYQ